VRNLLAITESHRKVWTEFSRRPELKRVLDERADAGQREISREEEIFVNLVIFHLNAVFYRTHFEEVVQTDLSACIVLSRFLGASSVRTRAISSP